MTAGDRLSPPSWYRLRIFPPNEAWLTWPRTPRDGSGLPSLKRPKRYIAVDRIPTSAVGKILRRELTEGRYHPLAEVRP